MLFVQRNSINTDGIYINIDAVYIDAVVVYIDNAAIYSFCTYKGVFLSVYFYFGVGLIYFNYFVLSEDINNYVWYKLFVGICLSL